MFKLRVLLVLGLFAATSVSAADLSDDEKSIEDEIQVEEDHQPTPVPKSDAAELTPDPVITPESPSSPQPRHEPEAMHEPVIEAPVENRPSSEPEYTGTEHANSSGRGEPIFDWSKHEGEQEVQHPFAEKGLLRITKDRTYYYKTEESPQTRAMTFRLGIFNPTNLSNPDEKGQPGATFHDNYSQSTSPAILVDYEWQLWQTEIGKIGIRAGSGFFLAQGNGHFVGGVNAGLTPKEVFTFITVPVNAGVVYRMKFFHRQMVVPYVEGGGTLFGFTETRDDNKAPKFGGALGAYVAAGGGLNLTYFDALARIQLDREYGISAVYLTAEYRQMIAFSRYDFTSPLINGGFCMEF